MDQFQTHLDTGVFEIGDQMASHLLDIQRMTMKEFVLTTARLCTQFLICLGLVVAVAFLSGATLVIMVFAFAKGLDTTAQVLNTAYPIIPQGH